MREQDHLGPLVGELTDCRRDALDTGCIGHFTVCNRNIEIDAQEHTLPGNVGEVVESLESRHG